MTLQEAADGREFIFELLGTPDHATTPWIVLAGPSRATQLVPAAWRSLTSVAWSTSAETVPARGRYFAGVRLIDGLGNQIDWPTRPFTVF